MRLIFFPFPSISFRSCPSSGQEREWCSSCTSVYHPLAAQRRRVTRGHRSNNVRGKKWRRSDGATVPGSTGLVDATTNLICYKMACVSKRSIFVVGQQSNYHRGRFRESYENHIILDHQLCHHPTTSLSPGCVFGGLHGVPVPRKDGDEAGGWTAFSDGRFWGPMESAWSTCGARQQQLQLQQTEQQTRFSNRREPLVSQDETLLIGRRQSAKRQNPIDLVTKISDNAFSIALVRDRGGRCGWHSLQRGPRLSQEIWKYSESRLTTAKQSLGEFRSSNPTMQMELEITKDKSDESSRRLNWPPQKKSMTSRSRSRSRNWQETSRDSHRWNKGRTVNSGWNTTVRTPSWTHFISISYGLKTIASN